MNISVQFRDTTDRYQIILSYEVKPKFQADSKIPSDKSHYIINKLRLPYLSTFEC